MNNVLQGGFVTAVRPESHCEDQRKQVEGEKMCRRGAREGGSDIYATTAIVSSLPKHDKIRYRCGTAVRDDVGYLAVIFWARYQRMCRVAHRVPVVRATEKPEALMNAAAPISRCS